MKKLIKFIKLLFIIIIFSVFIGKVEELNISASPLIIEKTVPCLNFQILKSSIIEIKIGKKGGAGVIYKIDTDYIYVLTANHIVKCQGKIDVQVRDHNFKKIRIENINRQNIISDNKVDLAIIKIPKPKNEIFTILNISKDIVKQGDNIYTIGHPLNFHYTVTEGIISNFVKRHYNNQQVEYMMISAPSFSGNSGGAVINDKGELIGIVVGIMYVGTNPSQLDKTLFLYHMTFVVKIADINRLITEVN